MTSLQVATNGLLSFSVLGVASDGYISITIVPPEPPPSVDYLSLTNRRVPVAQRRKAAIDALKKELWYLYQDENEEEVKETLNLVINDKFGAIDELITLLNQRMAEKQELAVKASISEYRDALLSARKIKKLVRQKKEDDSFAILF